MASAASLSLAQVGTPLDAGLTPRTPTIDVNTNYNNNSLETGSTAITANTNVVVGWEDDGADITYWGAAFTVYDRDGNLITPNSSISSVSPGAPCADIVNGPVTTTYRSFYRADGSATPSYTAWAAKVKANLFGTGFGLGGSADAIACEIPQFFNIQVDTGGTSSGDVPAVQFLNNDGSRDASIGGPDVAGIASFSDADAEAAGNIRMGDWERLANGNVVIVGESRQADDRLLTGQTGGNVVVYKVLNSTGGVVKAFSVVTSEVAAEATVGQEMWHGVGVTANGFAIRFSQGGAKVRLFDNDGNPQGPNIDLAAVTGHPEAGGGGRGDSTGFTGNGKDAYVHACPSAVGPWVTVLNANGTVRYSRQLTDPGVLGTGGGSDRMGAGIAADGRVIVAFQAQNTDTNNAIGGLPQARLFDPSGNPIGPVFYVSERETPANALAGNGGAGRPRAAFRGNTVAVMWGSLNSPVTPSIVLALRIFDVAPYALPTVSISQSGGNVIISWPASFGNLTLQSTPTLSPSGWTNVSPQPAIVPSGNENRMTVPIGPGNLFFRLAL